MSAPNKLCFSLLANLLLCGGAAWAAPVSDLCRVPRLDVSPNGRYVYYLKEGGQVVIAAWDCVTRSASSETDCPIMVVPSETADGTFFFAGNDTFLQEVSSTGPVSKIDIERLLTDPHYLDTPPPPLRIPEKNEPVAAYFTLAPSQKSKNVAAFVEGAQSGMKAAWRSHQDNPSLNARDIFGAIYGNRRVFLNRQNSMDVYIYSGHEPAQVFDTNGHAYDSPRENLSFKFDTTNAYVAVSGSILKIDAQNRPENITARMPRSNIIGGTTDLEYHGFYTQEKIYPANVTYALRQRMTASFEKVSGQYKTGMSVSSASGRYIVSTLQAAPTPGMRFNQRNLYAHSLWQNGVEAKIACLPKTLIYSERHVGKTDVSNSGLWLQSYRISGAKKKMLYVPGGPFSYQEPTTSRALAFFLANGYDVDIVNYGGGQFTYEMATRLNAQGIRSVQSDARDLDAVVGTGGYDALLMESFGGSFYRFMSTDVLSKVPATILYEPAGSSVPGFNMNTDRSRNLMRKVYGTELAWTYDTAFYQRLTQCQIVGRTLLVMGKTDDHVNPAFDYRHCWSDTHLQVLRHDGGHSDNVNGNYEAVLSFLNSVSTTAKAEEYATPSATVAGMGAHALSSN